jgi:hypothetical protein
LVFCDEIEVNNSKPISRRATGVDPTLRDRESGRNTRERCIEAFKESQCDDYLNFEGPSDKSEIP